MMTLQDQIEARLAEFFAVYKEIGSLREEFAMLQQADLAHAEYIQQTSQLEDEINALKAKKKQLEGTQQKTQIIDAGVRSFRPPLQPGSGAHHSRYEAKEVAHSTSGAQQPLQSARTDLKKLVGRWGRVWKLTGETRGRINRIADDPARPLGEALALLDWTTFENRIGTTEDEDAHLTRILSWGEALMEYRERLAGEIDTLKTKYRLVIPILEIWLGRNTDRGREHWEQQIAETRAAKEKEVETLNVEIDRLTAGGKKE